MWDIDSTTRLLQQTSRSTDPSELVRLFFDHISRGVNVHRAMVLNTVGLAPPEYRLVHDVRGLASSSEVLPSSGQVRTGGLLAALAHSGKLQSVAYLEVPPSDPAADLLRGARSLISVPLFADGVGAGAVVMLSPSAGSHRTFEVCALAAVTSLLGRAIEAQLLAARLDHACRSLDAELEAAADVQRWLLPSLPAVDGVALAASYRAARHAGGDYYDVGTLPDGRLGVLIADVSGKGAPAAVLMAVVRSIVHDEIDRSTRASPAALLDYAHARLRTLGLPRRGAFVTAFCGVLDTRTGILTYSCAGHPPPRMLRTRSREIEPLDGAATFPLGLIDEPHEHIEATIALAPGDIVLFYTDGITEARSPSGELFGQDRLDEMLRSLTNPNSPAAAVREIEQAVAAFSSGGVARDDQTLLVVRGPTGPPQPA